MFPSLAEGFGLPLVEARAHGCPVIASDLPALAEVADGGVSLFRANSSLAFKRCVLEAAAAPRREDVGRMASFTWDQSAAQLLARARALLDQN